MADLALAKTAAADLTRRIREAGEGFGRLLLEAHEGRAWEPMGYATWQDYVAGEFTFTARRSFQLLDEGRVQRLAGGPVTAAEARQIKADPRFKVKRVSLETPPSPAVQRLIEEQRATAAIPKPKATRRGMFGAEALAGAMRTLADRLEPIADAREAEESLPSDLERTARRLYDVLGRLL